MQSARRTANTLGELLRPVENKKVARLVLRRPRRAPPASFHETSQVLDTMAGRLHMTIADKVLAISLVVLSAALFLLIPRWVFSHATEVEIHAGDKLAGRYSLSEDRIVDVAVLLVSRR